MVLNLFFQHAYLFLFPAAVVEGPIITLAAGFLVSIHLLNPYIALPIIVIGDVVGDFAFYIIGRYGERWGWTHRILDHFHLSNHKEKMISIFREHPGKFLLTGKLTHALGLIFLVGAGYAGVDTRTFIWYNLAGAAVKSSVLMYAGFLAGAAYASYVHSLESGMLLVTSIAAIIVIVTVIIRKYAKAHDPLA